MNDTEFEKINKKMDDIEYLVNRLNATLIDFYKFSISAKFEVQKDILKLEKDILDLKYRQE